SSETKYCCDKSQTSKKRTNNACTGCRASKKKCSDEKPCTRCIKKDLTCKIANRCSNCRWKYVVEDKLYCDVCFQKLGYDWETRPIASNVTDFGPDVPLYTWDYSITTTSDYNMGVIQFIDVPLEDCDNTMNPQYPSIFGSVDVSTTVR
ncbi:4011_t:CDS:2, partial [Scutellospora calospora]